MQANQQVMGLGRIKRLRQQQHIPLVALVLSRDKRNVTRLAGAHRDNQRRCQQTNQANLRSAHIVGLIDGFVDAPRFRENWFCTGII